MAELTEADAAPEDMAAAPKVAETPLQFGRKMLMMTVGLVAVLLGATLMIMKRKKN